MDHSAAEYNPTEVLDFWFPDDGFRKSREAFGAWIFHRMQGGVDKEICDRFEDLTTAAAKGLLDDWASSPRGRLALLIALDQFPRSLWRDTPTEIQSTAASQPPMRKLTLRLATFLMFMRNSQAED